MKVDYLYKQRTLSVVFVYLHFEAFRRKDHFLSPHGDFVTVMHIEDLISVLRLKMGWVKA